MSDPQSLPTPSEMDLLRRQLELVLAEVRTVGLEVRAGRAEQRTEVTELRGYVLQIIDTLTELRGEFDEYVRRHP
jgi:hypothetical protein